LGGDKMFSNSNWRVKLSQVLRQPDFTKEPTIPDRFIIEMHSRHSGNKIGAIIDANQGKVHQEMRLIPSLVVELPYASLEELAKLRHVKRIWHDTPVRIRLDVAVPSVGAAKAHELGFTGKNVTIAVIDTGIYPHRDLTLPANRIIGWQDILHQKDSPYDDNGHGTHVSGIIAGNGISSRGKYQGMAPEAMLVGVKALDENGGGSISNVLTGIEWCIENLSKLNIKAINMSFGSKAQESYHQDPLCRATSIAWSKGLVVCAAAGNAGPDYKTIDTPGINPKVITVGNVDDHQTLSYQDDLLSRSSSRGPTIDNINKPNLLAPGTNITSTWINGSYRSLSGTSMSTPMVCGAVALISQKWPNLKPDQIKQLIMKNAHDLGLGINLQGAGVLDLREIFTSETSRSTALSRIRINSHDLGDILGYHFMETLLNRIGIKPTLFLKKRDEAIKKTLFSLIKSYFTQNT
jgi:serine protease AprX